MKKSSSFAVKKFYNFDIIDKKTNRNVFWGDQLSISYTLLEDDVKGARLNTNTPYESRRANLSLKKQTKTGYVLENHSLKAELSVSFINETVFYDLTSASKDISEFGLNLPFNFMGKKGGGNFDEQYLFNSPYRSMDGEYKYCYLKNIKGRDVFVVFLSQADGWKMEYSPWVGGHYFCNLKCLANFDKVYNTGSQHKSLKIAMFFADDYLSGLKKVAKLFDAPVLYYDKSYTFSGQCKVKVLGNCDKIALYKNGVEIAVKNVQGDSVIIDGVDEKTVIVPFVNGKKGLDCSVYGFNNLVEKFKLANDAIASYNGAQNLGNLCECQFWASAMLRYMLRFGRVKEYDECLNKFFDVLLPKEIENAVVRLSIVEQAVDGFPKYSVYKSRRIQEHFAGVSILLDAYKVYKKELFLDYAKQVLNSLIDNYQAENGAFLTTHGGGVTDYSTVTCLMLAIVDMAEFFKDKDQALYEKYFNSATKLASYIYFRGLSFPTEGGDSDLAEEQMEDGSISCSALSLLYYSAKLVKNNDYIVKAKEILDLHEAWVMSTPDANAYRSSLRWWETRWEGDKDGPALCVGHGWTIWRSEADFWYYKLTGDKQYLHKALCGFTTGFAKFDKQGRGKAVYHMDYIAGGGFQFDKQHISYNILEQFPQMIDVKTSYYVWARAFETVLELTDSELND